MADVGARADRVIARLRALTATHWSSPAAISSASWAPAGAASTPSAGKSLYLSTAALSAVGYEHGLDSPVLRLWNDCRHVEA